MKENKKRVVVIGGGIMGLSSAIWLLRSGRPVTIVDPGIARRPASFGNAGVLAACSVVPVTTPGLISKAPLLLLDPNFPLFVRWRYLPKLLPWLVRYLKHANASDAARIAKGLAPLTRDTYAQHKALAGGTAAERWLQSSGYFFAYDSRAAFEADAFGWQLRREAGFAWQEFEGERLRELEPSLGPKIGFGILLQDHGFVLSPGGYIAALREVAASLGAITEPAEARGFRLAADGSVQAVITTNGEIEADAAVIATGAWSKMLTAQLGLDVPLETERGYHVMFYGPSVKPRQPTMVASGKFVATPMADGRALRRRRRIRRAQLARAQAADRADFATGERGLPGADLHALRRMARSSAGAERQPAVDRRGAASPRHIPCFWSSPHRAHDGRKDRTAAGSPGQRRAVRNRHDALYAGTVRGLGCARVRGS